MTIIDDKELGRLVVRVNPQAKRLVFRTKSDAIYVSVPQGVTRKELNDAIESLRQQLLASLKKVSKPRRIDLSYKIDTEYFKLSLIQGVNKQYLADSELGKMKIICPPNADFENNNTQLWLRKVIEEALRRNAKIILPSTLNALSVQFNLPYNSVKISSSKGRWGSCSSSKNINLSYYLILLPQHLIDYVLLHELCHTREMNHSDKFWTLMDAVTANKAQRLKEELRKYKTEI